MLDRYIVVEKFPFALNLQECQYSLQKCLKDWLREQLKAKIPCINWPTAYAIKLLQL